MHCPPPFLNAKADNFSDISGRIDDQAKYQMRWTVIGCQLIPRQHQTTEVPSPQHPDQNSGTVTPSSLIPLVVGNTVRNSAMLACRNASWPAIAP